MKISNRESSTDKISPWRWVKRGVLKSPGSPKDFYSIEIWWRGVINNYLIVVFCDDKIVVYTLT